MPAALTVMFDVVAALLHRYVYPGVPPLGFTVNVCEPPAQIVALGGVTVQLGFGWTVNVAALEIVARPQASSTHTSYEPPSARVAGEIVNVDVFAPAISPPSTSGTWPPLSPLFQPLLYAASA